MNEPLEIKGGAVTVVFCFTDAGDLEVMYRCSDIMALPLSGDCISGLTYITDADRVRVISSWLKARIGDASVTSRYLNEVERYTGLAKLLDGCLTDGLEGQVQDLIVEDEMARLYDVLNTQLFKEGRWFVLDRLFVYSSDSTSVKLLLSYAE